MFLRPLWQKDISDKGLEAQIRVGLSLFDEFSSKAARHEHSTKASRQERRRLCGRLDLLPRSLRSLRAIREL